VASCNKIGIARLFAQFIKAVIVLFLISGNYISISAPGSAQRLQKNIGIGALDSSSFYVYYGRKPACYKFYLPRYKFYGIL